MKVPVLNIKGKTTGREIELSKNIFGIDPNEHAVYLDVKQFLALLHRTITNRALNLALHKTIDQSLKDDLIVGPCGRRVSEEGQQTLADMLSQCLDIVDQEYQTLRSDMRQFQ